MASPISTVRRLADGARARARAFAHRRQPKHPAHRDAERRPPTPALERGDGIHDAQTPAPVRKSGAGAACRDPDDRLARSLVALIAALLPLLVVDLPPFARRREPRDVLHPPSSRAHTSDLKELPA